MDASAKTWQGHALASLAEAGHRAGRARRAIVEHLARQTCSVGANEIFEALRAEARPVGLASIYRVLDQLVRLRLVHRLDFGEGARYEPLLPSGEHHHHVVCDECGKVEPFADEPLEDALDRLGNALGFELEGHDVVLRGSCGDCRATAG